MVGFFAIVVSGDDFCRDVFFLEAVAVELMTNQRQAGFCKAHRAVRFFHRRQARSGELVLVAAGMAAEIGEVLALFFREEADRVVVTLLQIIKGVAAWLDVDRRDLTTVSAWRPDRAQAAPADRHRVVILWRASSDQRPVIVEKFEDIRVEFLDRFHENASLLFLRLL